jgi:hypothetical protein
MPNDCWNKITIIANQDELITLMHNELMYTNIKNKLIFHHHITLIEQGERGIKIKCWSAWKPNFEWLSKMIHSYKSCWIKNEWYEESGLGGIWIGQNTLHGPSITNYSWSELSIDEEYYYFKSSESP